MAVIGRFGGRTFQRLKVKVTLPQSGGGSQSGIPDTTPDQFLFVDVSGVPAATLETSNAVTVTGLGASVAAIVTVSGDPSSEVERNGGIWSAGPVVAQNGDTLRVRHTSSASALTAVSTTLTVGDVSDTFTSTTEAISSAAGEPLGLLLLFTKAA
jgi:hypothetical protein